MANLSDRVTARALRLAIYPGEGPDTIGAQLAELAGHEPAALTTALNRLRASPGEVSGRAAAALEAALALSTSSAA